MYFTTKVYIVDVIPIGVVHLIGTATNAVVFAVRRAGAVEFYLNLDPVGQVGVTLAVALVVGLVVFGLLPGYSTQVVRTGRRSPVISACVGLPGTVVLVGLLYVGFTISDTSVGVFVAIPLVSVATISLPVWTALGLVIVGASIGGRFGFDTVAVWLVVGSALVALATLVPAVATVVATVAAILGVGAGVRVLVGSGVTSGPDERTIPPANRV